MFAAIFEVHPKPERREEYLRLAGMLKPELEAIDGFIEVERFASRRRPGWLLSLSIWRDETALIRWRTHATHHAVQATGRAEIFHDYRLRVGELLADSLAPAAGGGKLATLIDWSAPAPAADTAPDPAAVEWDRFTGILRPDHQLLLTFRAGPAAAAAGPPPPQARQRSVRIIRDYGMFARAEAPQYYPPPPAQAASRAAASAMSASGPQ
jgi:heme-degrading monooxygenase HmoA